METIILKDNEYRICQLNAIEILAFRTQIDFDNYDSSLKIFNLILENIEVKCKDKWVPVKLKNQKTYFPVGIENDLEVIQELIKHFQDNLLKPVFPKSNA